MYGAKKLDPMTRRWGDVGVDNVIENKEVCVKVILAKHLQVVGQVNAASSAAPTFSQPSSFLSARMSC